MEITSKKLQIGPYKILPVPTGIFGLDGGAMFGTVPKVLWEKTNPPDEKNRIAMEARALLLLSDNKKILIDCGNGSDFVAKFGEKLGGKFEEMYAVSKDGASLTKSLALHGLATSDITDVILTHLHFDHAGGGTTERKGSLVPTFENARYYVQRRNLETAQKPNIREKASYFAANFQPLLDAKVLDILDGPVENLLPGVSVEMSDGHTQGQQFVRISDGNQTLVYCGDLIPTSTHVRLPFIMGYDLNPLLLIEEKQRLLTKAAKENWYLYFEHDPYIDAAQVIPNQQDFQVSARYQLL